MMEESAEGNMQPTNEAERLLVQQATQGSELADVTRTDEPTVRAALIRDLCVHAEERGVHAKGIRLRGAVICGQLDLTGATVKRPLFLEHCCFREPINLWDSHMRTIGLTGSIVPGIQAERVQIDGALLLRTVTATDQVRLVQARIDGDLACQDSTFESRQGECIAFNAPRMQVGGLFYWSLRCPPIGTVNLGNAHVRVFADTARNWPEQGKLILDGFTYDSLAFDAPVTWRERSKWLALQPDFRPQPYEQLTSLLRRMGHERDARKISIARQDDFLTRGRTTYLNRQMACFSGLP